MMSRVAVVRSNAKAAAAAAAAAAVCDDKDMIDDR